MKYSEHIYLMYMLWLVSGENDGKINHSWKVLYVRFLYFILIYMDINGYMKWWPIHHNFFFFFFHKNIYMYVYLYLIFCKFYF